MLRTFVPNQEVLTFSLLLIFLFAAHPRNIQRISNWSLYLMYGVWSLLVSRDISSGFLCPRSFKPNLRLYYRIQGLDSKLLCQQIQNSRLSSWIKTRSLKLKLFIVCLPAAATNATAADTLLLRLAAFFRLTCFITAWVFKLGSLRCCFSFFLSFLPGSINIWRGRSVQQVKCCSNNNKDEDNSK